MPPKKRRRKFARTGCLKILFSLVLLVIFVGAGISTGLVVNAVRNMPAYDIDNISGSLSSILYDREGQEVTKLKAEKSRIALDSDAIPKMMKEALIAIEDQRFYSHRGFDPIRFMGAVVANFKEGYGAEGGSTLTQQLVKIAVLENPEKKIRRKIQEVLIAFKIESKYEKDEILAMYLNNVYYGHGAWSLQTAAQIYFAKDVQDLNLGEYAMLAGVINAPGRYSPYLNPEKAKQRQSLVLSEMVNMGFISESEAKKAADQELSLAGLNQQSYQYQSFTDVIIEEAAEKLDIADSDIGVLYTAGYRIYTTMDKKTQDAAEAAYEDDAFFPPDKNDKIVQSAMVILDHQTGEVWTIVGGRKQDGERQFNRAVSAARQPGSAFKPIAVYAPALEKGYGPATVLDDYPEEYQTPAGVKSFINYDEKTRGYRGLISMRTAIQWSVNTAAVKMLEKIGITEGFDFAQKMGISTLVASGKANDMGLSLALGGLTKGVTPIEMAVAYGTFANGGVRVKPHVIRKIEDNQGNILYEHSFSKTEVMSPQTAYLITDMLRSVVEGGTAGKARMNRPVAGKTGTTSFDVDAWFCGYTANLSGVVWMGFDKEEAMSGVYGGTVCGPLWKEVMTVAHEDIPVTEFMVPDNIKTVQVDYKSGLLPSPLTPEEFLVQELFNGDHVPTEMSNVWIQLPVCADSGELPTDFCPHLGTGIFLSRAVPWSGEAIPQDAELEAPTVYCTLHGGSAGTSSSLRLQGSAVAGDNDQVKSIRLYWTHPIVSSSTLFNVYRSINANVALNEKNLVAQIGTGTSTWEDTEISPGSKYYYAITAYEPQTGQISFVSNEINVSTMINLYEDTISAPILKGTASFDGSAVTADLSWSFTSGKNTIVYYIFRSDKPGFEPSPANQVALGQNIKSTSWTDSGLTRNKRYYYRIIAFDSATQKQSPPSNELQIHTP